MEFGCVWWGHNALEIERKWWEIIKATPVMEEFSFVMEAQANDEMDAIDSRLTADGWEMYRQGSGSARRIYIYGRGFPE
jgi:hypothetical protein